MKIYLFTLILILSSTIAFPQESSKIKSSFIGLRVSTVPVTVIAESDTSYENALSLNPVFDLRTKSGWGITYSPSVVVSGHESGLYMHSLSGGYEQYGRKSFDLAANYTRYFFTNNTSVPYSAVSNEIYFFAAYNKTWMVPMIASSIGFGKASDGQYVHEIGLVGGVSHDFNWEKNRIFTLIELDPSLLINAATNGYFSFLQTSRYISNSHHFTSYVKNKGKGKGSTPSIEFSNLELNLESDFEKGPFSIHPAASAFIPFAGSSDHSFYGYEEITLKYSF